eukprot:TRINITY_DN80548_c0_g1_i1.p1 TRINITY_DN80548_c0_g1~~TRINITY_DN80548_c0_g1_i1.p1  ORF type:complete len:338 (-),score=43.99 TRINITY_DN80548_c0_g1_i1:196-1062(-)
MWCHLGSSSLETLPGVPIESAGLVPVSLAIGSPPGLSRASMRQARDACKLQVSPSWHHDASTTSMLTIGPSGKALSPPQVLKLARRRAAREAIFARAKEQMMRLQSQETLRTPSASSGQGDSGKVLSSFTDSVSRSLVPKTSAPFPIEDMDDNEESTDVGFDGTSEDDSASDWSCSESLCRAPSGRCRFNGSALETIPATPVAGAPSVGSPPGLSRSSMRRARDACKAALPRPTWGGYLSSAAPSVPDKPITPTSLCLANLRAARDSLSAPVLPDRKWADAEASLIPR